MQILSPKDHLVLNQKDVFLDTVPKLNISTRSSNALVFFAFQAILFVLLLMAFLSPSIS